MDEFQTRRDALGALLATQKLDALLVTHPANVRYLTGFTGSNGVVLALRDDAVFYTDPRYRTQSALQVTCSRKIVKGPITKAVAKRSFRSLGFERDSLRYSDFATLAENHTLTPVAGLVEQLRARKSPQEIDLIRQSVMTNSKAFERAIRAVKPGMTEGDLAAEIEYRMRLSGGDRPAFETIVATGANAALPHSHPGASKIGDGLLLIDMGTMRNGYASDMTRMLHLGRPSKKAREMYRMVLDAQLAAIDAVRPGVTGAAVDRAARNVLKIAGYGKQFIHSTGHGLGLEIHEDPRIGVTGKKRLEAGMAITIEPGVYVEGWGGIRIEDTVMVTASGCEVLTPTSKELKEL